jgi:hypothetical protein
VSGLRRASLAACGGNALLLVAIAAAAAPPLQIRLTPHAGLPARAAALLVSGQQGGPIVTSALAVPLRSAGNRVRLGVVIDIDGESLLSGRRTGTLDVLVGTYAVAANGAVAASLAAGFVLDLAGAAVPLERGGIKVVETLDAPADTRLVRTLVYVPDGSSFALREVSADLPPGTAGGAFTSSPVFADPPAAWLLAGEGAVEGAAWPFVLSSEAVVPATRAVIVGGAPRQAWLVTRGLPPAALAVSATIAADAGNGHLAAVPVDVLDRVAGTEFEVLHVSFAVPELPPGFYTLTVAAPPAPPAAAPVIVAPPAATGEAVAWISFAAPAPAGETRTVAVPSRKVKLQAVDTLKGDYLTALAALAGDGRDAAAAAVAEVERRALEGATVKERTRLEDAEEAATRELVAAEPAAALGLLALHLDLHTRYEQSGMFALQMHAGTRIQQLAAAVAIRGGRPDSRALAADALTCFAGTRYRVGDLVVAAQMFHQALLYDAANATALEGLGGVFEASGLFKQAVDPLAALQARHPENAVVRLRLALNLGRTGERKRSAALLSACVTADNAAWIRAVAWQEMAARAIIEERWDDAAAVVDAGLAALPAEPGLSVQRAFILDRTGRVLEARALARRVLHDTAEPSPRYRYAWRPSQEATADCAVIAELRPGAEAALGRAIATLRKDTK